MAVNCFDVDPMSTTVSVVIGTVASSRAAPNASANTTSPPRDAATVQPGTSAVIGANIARVASAAASSVATGGVVADESVGADEPVGSIVAVVAAAEVDGEAFDDPSSELHAASATSAAGTRIVATRRDPTTDLAEPGTRR